LNRATPTPRQLKVLELNVPFHSPAGAAPADSGVDPIDDDLVSLRSESLRAPLSDMLGFAELIASSDLTNDQRELYTESLLREGRRLTALVDHALGLRRLETGRRDLDIEPVDVRSLIHRAVMVAGQDERTPIGVRMPDQLPLVSADAEAILEVLGNFLSNARVFSPKGGAITIEAHAAADVVEISIRDHGVGLVTDDLPRLFKKFYRNDTAARRHGPGAGLGLAINHMIIEAHGGQVSVMSKGPGKGARFQFTLPLARPIAPSEYILIVEDDAVFAALVKAEFAIFGMSSVRAADAETAEHILLDAPPRAVVLDLVLPGIQGEDFLAHIQAGNGAGLPVVVVTAKDLTPAEISALESAGALAVLPKEAGAPQAAVALIADALALDLLTL
jgi:CheY-like chemotaxis protein